MGDALGASGRALRGIFERLGHEFVEIDLSKPNAAGLMNETITNKRIEFALSHVGMAADFAGETSDKRQVNLWAGNAIPFISFFGDSPAYFFDRHVMPGSGFACFYAFPEHYALRKTLPHRRGLLGITPLRAMDETPKAEIDFRMKESGKLLFLKNGNDPQQLIDGWRNGLPLGVFEMLTDLSSHLVGRIHLSEPCDIDGVVRTYFKDRGLDIEEMISLRLFFVAQLDDYLRRVKSTSMAEVLKRFPIEIHGYNWKHVDFSGQRAKYFYGADYTASGSMIKRALGIIDMSPNTTLHPHDRALRAFGLHTLCLTNEQEFFRKHFPRHTDFTFAFDGESLASRVADVLAHPKRFVELGIEIAQSFHEQFDSDAFGRTMLEAAACLRMGATETRPTNMQDFFVWPPKKLS
jgi:hypothetical protein